MIFYCIMNYFIVLSLFTLFRDRNVIVSIAAYCMTSFVVIGLDELFPLWAATQHSLGKLIIVAEDIGIARIFQSGGHTVLK